MDETVTNDNTSSQEDETFNTTSNMLDDDTDNNNDVGDRTIKMTILNGTPIATLNVGGVDMLCLAQISATILQRFSYNEIHNRRVALSISTKPCNASQMELLRCAGAVPSSSRRCGLITRHEADRLVRSFTEGTRPPNLPAGFAFNVGHHCGWGCRGRFYVEKYTSSRAKCIECADCDEVLAPNKFIFHSHRPRDVSHVSKEAMFRPADAANFNSWRRHIFLVGNDDELESNISEAWEDVKALFNGGNRQNVNVLTMTTLVSASVGGNSAASSGTASSTGAGTPLRIKRERSLTANSSISQNSSSEMVISNKRPCNRTNNSRSAKRQTPTTHRQHHQQLIAEVEDANAGIETSPPAPQCQVLPSVSFAPPPFAAPPSSALTGANFWLVDTLFRSLLSMPQTTAAGASPSSLPLFNNPNELIQSPTILNAEQLAAINLVKQKWPSQQNLPRQTPQSTANPNQQLPADFLIKNIVGMNE